ncbi:hypothetical protein Ahy_A09g046286 isoform A [Arachis hypogaea]|uniref:F-box domain-containing protein n=1 Tax=Arachis hypogaea TaxID=3818 RepID=A0A445BPC1_ARAHY|nr:hypothetical protein Ahy_A09g046286 isoform A [Arachis hypogaea]
MDTTVAEGKRMDRLTSLPEVIILDDILTRLPYKDAARTSVLSKEWRDTWYSFPILSICSKDFFSMHDVLLKNPLRFSNQDMLIHYVTKRLLKLLDQGLAIKVFKLNMQCVDHKKMFYHVDLWMKMVSENGVQELELRLPLPTAYVAKGCTIDQEYDLPLCVIEAKSLTKLVLRGKIRFHQAFLNHSIKLFSVLFSHEGIVENLISHCPLIEHLTINDCYIYNPLSVPCPVRSLFLHGLEKLKEADIRGIQGVYIDAPNLENLCYCPLDVYAPFKLNLDSFTNLRCLRLFFLEGSIITDKWFVELFHKFHFLESLSLLCCSMSEKINILSVQLKHLKLSIHCSNSREVNIDAPNLLSCQYYGNFKIAISFLRYSNQLELSFNPTLDYKHNYYSLREFIQNIKPQMVLASLSLSIQHLPGIEQILSQIQVSSTPPTIKRLGLQCVPKNEALYFPYVNWLLSSCCPRTIIFILHSDYDRKPFILFMYELLMGGKKWKWFHHFSDTKCWWHELKNVKVTSSFKVHENVDLETMLDSFPKSDGEEYISFSLELDTTVV